MSEKVLAVAAGHEITEKEVNDLIKNYPPEQQIYMSSPQAKQQVLEQVIMEDPDIDHTTAPIVCVDSLGSSEVVIGLRCFCPTEKYWPTRWRLTEKAKLSLDEAGIEIPFQQVSVHISPDA